MRFEFYHDGLAETPLVSVDGIVPGAALHLSHWDGNHTPVELKADTSTEIALRFVASPDRDQLARTAGVATNNHFDCDGALSVWTVVEGPRALEQEPLLVAAAEAGDFSAYAGRDALKVSLAIQGEDGDAGSPLAGQGGRAAATDPGSAYRAVLPRIADLLARPDAYEPLWRAGLARIDAAMESFARGRSIVEEDADRLVSVIVLAADIAGATAFDPMRHAPPLTAISHHARGRLYVIATPGPGGGWSYQVDWPYWSWAETVARPRIERADLSDAAARLSALEPDGPTAATWRIDRGEMTSALKPMASADADIRTRARSRIAPERVGAELRAALKKELARQDPA